MASQPDGKTKVLNLLNARNQQSFTLTDLIISLPVANTDGDPANRSNTKVMVSGSLSTPTIGTNAYYYNREWLGHWVANNAPSGVRASVQGISKISELLVVLNNLYNSGFSLEDFAEGDLPTGPFPYNLVLNVLDTSYSFTGQMVVTLLNNVVPIESVLPVSDLGDLDGSTPCGSGNFAYTHVRIVPPYGGTSDQYSPASF